MKTLQKINATTKKASFLGFTLLALYSCDPSVDYKKIIENKSTKDLSILIQDPTTFSGKYSYDTVIVKSGSEYTAIHESGMGTIEKDHPDCSGGDSLFYINPINKNVVNFSNSPDWIYTPNKENHFGGGRVECRFVFTDALFVK